jgi:heptaprenyl diphosphate synthase
MKTKRLTELAFLTTVALIIFVIELRIPSLVPVPGVKLGLANIITVYAIYRYTPKEVLLVILVRIVLGALFGGNMMALAYSLAGGLLCLAGVIPLHKIVAQKDVWMLSVLGAVLHNVGQLTMAFLVTGTAGVFAYLPFLMVAGCIAGFFTGICAGQVLKRL